jgi:NDP-sugar pyrophosphorylase family protein
MKKKISITIDEKTLRNIDSTIDNIMIRNRSQAIEFLLSSSLSEKKSAVILCGGDPLNLSISKTEFRPTVMVKGGYLIEHAIRKLKKNGFTEIYIIARGQLLTSIFNILKEGSGYGVSVSYIEEKESNGSFDSLRLISSKTKKDFLVIYGDLFFNNVNIEEIWNDHMYNNAVSTIMMTTSSRPSEKGTLKVEGSRVLEFAQKPSVSDIYLVFSPIFACQPEIFNYNGHSLEIDVFPKLAKKGLLKGHLSSEKEIHIHQKTDIKKIN